MNFNRYSVRGNERAWELRRLRSMPIRELINSIYPRMFALHSLQDEEGDLVECMDGFMAAKLPNQTCVTAEVFESDGIYLMDDSMYLWLYIGRNVSASRLEELFGIRANTFEKPSIVQFCQDSDEACRMNAIVEALRYQSTHKQGLCIFDGID